MISYKPLLKILIDRDMTKEDLRAALSFSPNVVAKFNKNDYVSLEVIDKICNYLDCGITDVIEHVKDTGDKNNAN